MGGQSGGDGVRVNCIICDTANSHKAQKQSAPETSFVRSDGTNATGHNKENKALKYRELLKLEGTYADYFYHQRHRFSNCTRVERASCVAAWLLLLLQPCLVTPPIVFVY